MKRKSNLYKDVYNIENIEKVYREVCKNTNNKKHVKNLKEYHSIYIARTYDILYIVGPYNHFTIL